MREHDKQAVSLLLNWLKQLSVHGRITSKDYKTLETIYKTEEEVKEMLITAIKKEKGVIFDSGKREGKIDVVKAMFLEGVEISLISKVTGLAEAEIMKLK